MADKRYRELDEQVVIAKEQRLLGKNGKWTTIVKRAGDFDHKVAGMASRNLWLTKQRQKK